MSQRLLDALALRRKHRREGRYWVFANTPAEYLRQVQPDGDWTVLIGPDSWPGYLGMPCYVPDPPARLP